MELKIPEDSPHASHGDAAQAPSTLGPKPTKDAQPSGKESKQFQKKSHVEQFSGLQGLMRVYGSRQKYNGGWHENLFGTIENYEISATLCNLTAEKRHLGIPVILKVIALSYYASHIRNSARTYKEAIQMLKNWLYIWRAENAFTI